MKIGRSESQGNTKTKFFCIEKSEINPVEMEMRHNERMTSKNIRSGQQKRQRSRRSGVGGCYKSKNMFQPVETAMSANWPDSNTHKGKCQ